MFNTFKRLRAELIEKINDRRILLEAEIKYHEERRDKALADVEFYKKIIRANGYEWCDRCSNAYRGGCKEHGI